MSRKPELPELTVFVYVKLFVLDECDVMCIIRMFASKNVTYFTYYNLQW